MKEIKLPIEVQLVVRSKDLPDTCELLLHLQDIVDEWYRSKVPTIPCAFIRKNR
jgi:hypothetical protein